MRGTDAQERDGGGRALLVEGTACAKAQWQRGHGRCPGLKRQGRLERRERERLRRASFTRLGLAGCVKAMECGLGFTKEAKRSY